MIIPRKDIDAEMFEQYDALQLQLYRFNNEYTGNSTSRGSLGILEYRLFLDDSNIIELEKNVAEISEIVAKLTD